MENNYRFIICGNRAEICEKSVARTECYISSLGSLKRLSGIVISRQHCVPLSMGNRTICQDADDSQSLKKNLPPISALLSAFVGSSIIFYALWIANFDDREWLGFLLGIVGIGTGAGMFCYGLNIILLWNVGSV